MRIAIRLAESLVIIACFLLFFGAAPVAAQQRFDVAVIYDGSEDRLAGQRRTYVDELLALTEDEFDVRIQAFRGEWTEESIEAAFAAAYENPEIDMVLVTGFIASQLGTQRTEYPKPTFLPLILDPGLLMKPPSEGKSGIPNLSYLLIYANFGDDLDSIAELVDVDKVALLIDVELFDAIPQLRVSANAICEERGIELVPITHDGVDHKLAERVPDGTDAIFVSGLPRMPKDAFLSFVDAINERGLASYSFVGTEDVEAGLLMTSSETRDLERQARLNALNMQAVMLGERPEDQTVLATARKQYTINMETARKLGVSPSFDILGVATLLNERPAVTGDEYGLVEIARLAIRQNQDLASQAFATKAGAQDITSARADLLPQLDLSTSYNTRKKSPVVESGLFAERSTDAALGLQQVIYADPLAANLVIQRQLQASREASLSEFRLDIVQAATTAYYTVLNANSQLGVQVNNLAVTRRNLELARDRVELGTSSSSDVYRWEAEEARAQIRVIDARTAVDQAWNQLNRLLNQPLEQRLPLKEAMRGDPFVISLEEWNTLVTSPADYAKFAEFAVARGISQAPEITQIDAQLAAKERELTSRKRETWLPQFSVGGQLSSNLNQSGAGAGPSAGQDLEDWSVGVQATLPLFSGGSRRADISRASLEVMQLRALRASAAEKVEERIRLQLHAAYADYPRIDLSITAANAARRNYELVADAYARGAVTIIELLDAQDASLTADAAAADSLYRFLITIMALQRATGGFDFLLGPGEREELATLFRENLRRSMR